MHTCTAKKLNTFWWLTFLVADLSGGWPFWGPTFLVADLFVAELVHTFMWWPWWGGHPIRSHSL